MTSKARHTALACQSRTNSPERFDIILLIALMVQCLLWLVGLHAQQQGWDKHFQANTIGHRTVLSTIRLGLEVLRRPDYQITEKELLAAGYYSPISCSNMAMLWLIYEGSFSVQHDTTEQDFLIQRGKDKDGQQRQDHIGYGLIGKSFVINGSAGRSSTLPSRNSPTYTTAIAPVRQRCSAGQRPVASNPAAVYRKTHRRYTSTAP